MRLPDVLFDWLHTATSQMRWKRAQPVAEKELRAHIEDQYEAFMDEGMDQAAAAKATAREMGDPVETGTRLDRVWRPRPDWLMLGMVLVIAAAGLILQYRFRWSNDVEWYMLLGKYVSGVACLLIAYFADYTLLGRHIVPLLGVWFAGWLALHWPLRNGMPNGISGIMGWMWLFPVVFAGLIYRLRGKGTEGLGICLTAVFGMALCGYGTFRTGAEAAMMAVCGIQLVVAVRSGLFGKRRKWWYLLAALPLAQQLYFCIHIGWFVSRWPDDPIWSDYTDKLVRAALYSADGGAFTSTLVYDRATDYLLVSAKVEWGWTAFILILGVLAALLLRGWWMLRSQSGVLVRLVSAAVLLTLFAQMITYTTQNLGIAIAANHGLPLLSYGGTYLCQTMFLLGVLLSAQRTGGLEPGTAPVKEADINA